MLDLTSVRLFVLAVEFGNLTRAAQAAGTVQPVVSTRIKALESALGRKLLERTPRFVRPTEDGVAFLVKAQALLAAHEEATRFADEPTVRFALGVSDHALGSGLEQVIRQIRLALPRRAAIELRLTPSHRARQEFDDGKLDAIIIRREAGGSDGEVLGIDHLGWRALDGEFGPTSVAIPLVMLAPPCGVRSVAIRSLDASHRPWREAFTGGSCASLLAAVRAGLGVAPMGAVASGRMADLGPSLNLPQLPPSEIVMFARASSAAANAAAGALGASVQSMLRSP